MFDKLSWPAVGAAVWLAGVLFLAARVAKQNAVFLRQPRQAREVSGPEAAGLLEECRRLLGVAGPVRLAEMEHIRSPALYGLFAPRMLLPAGLSREFSREELRHVFLHELAHLKRRDMAVHCLAGFLHLLNWFNPVLWFAFRRMAADRELACDELALSCAGEGEKRAYGQTIIKLLEQCSRPAALPGLMGILEDKTQMRRRILMIAAFKPARRWSLLAGVILAVLALVALTDAQVRKATALENSDKVSKIWSGTVLLPNGQPAAGAAVSVFCLQPDSASSWGGLLWADPARPGLPLSGQPGGWADAAGRFSIIAASNSTAVLVADPQGFAVVAVGAFNSNKTVTLEPWGKITGVLLHGSTPTTDTQLTAAITWRTFPGRRQLSFEFDAWLDANGRFEFDHLPPGVAAIGLGGGLKIQGTNLYFRGGVIKTVEVQPGATVDLTLTEPDVPEEPKSAFQLQTEKALAESEAQRQAQMAKANALPDPEPPLSGTVLLPDGQPAEGARVVRWGLGIVLEISNAAVWADTNGLSRWATNPIIANPNRLIIADSQGRFVLPAMIDTYGDSRTHWVFATRSDGYASATAESVKAAQPMTLRPWGRIEGTLRLGGKPVSNALVRLDSSAPNVYTAFAISAATDEQGRFVLSNVPPERFTLRWNLRSGPSRGEEGSTRPVDVQPGVATTVALGEAGRPVTGRLVANTAAPGLDWTKARIRMSSLPVRWPIDSVYFQPAASGDGTFRFDDVPPGIYEFSANFPQASTPGFTVAEVTQKIAVAELVGGRGAGALDLGDVKMKIFFPLDALKVGDTVPPMELTDLSGKPVKLEDFRGKYLLARFLGAFDNGAGSFAAAMGRAYRQDGRLIVLTVGYIADQIERTARADMVNNGDPCIYAYSGLSQTFGKQTAVTMLIAPDGKVLATDLRDAGMRDAVARALGSGQTNAVPGEARDDSVTGTVLLPNGKPAAGATVAVSGQGFNALAVGDGGGDEVELSGTRLTTRMSEDHLRMLRQQENRNPNLLAAARRMMEGTSPPPHYTNGPVVLADAEGRFRIPVKKLGQYLFAAHEGGFARIGPGSLESPVTIQLQAWGRVEGTVRNGAASQTNVSFSLGSQMQLPRPTQDAGGSWSPGQGQGVVPDRAGRLTFTNVVPGEYDVTRWVTTRNGSATTSSGKTIAHLLVEPGKVTPLEVNDTDNASNNVPFAPPRAVPTSSRAPSNETSAINGTVLLPNGRPAAGAQVALTATGYQLELNHAELIGNTSLVVIADRDGRFSLPPKQSALGIVALNENGYAEVGVREFENGSKITLQPWGRIEGVLRIGARLGTNEEVSLAVFGRIESIFHNSPAYRAVTDREGKFVFTDVPPVVCGVSHKGVGDQFTIMAGQTNRITVGGTGRPVIGKLLASMTARTGGKQWTNIALEAEPGDRGSIPALIAPDGTFRMEDVKAGTWGLSAEVLLSKTGGGVQLICVAGRTIVVPEMPGGRSDEPLDLGTVEPIMVHSPQIGETVPSFDVRTTDGTAFKLADQSGKYVLLDFEPLGAYPGAEPVRAVWEAFGTNDRLAVLTLIVQPMGGYAIESWGGKFPWPTTQVSEMPWYRQYPLRASLGLPVDSGGASWRNLPGALLLGPDGRIVATDLHGDAIKAAVAKAMEAK